MKRFKTAEEFIDAFPQWKKELECLRDILCSANMEETIKWGAPVYTVNGKNVVGLGAFKSYVGLWFFQGALMTDPAGVLMNAQEGKTKAMLQWRFQDISEINNSLVLDYVREAIQNQEQGHEIKPVRNQRLVLPAHLKEALSTDDKLGHAFSGLTPGFQREYAEYIAGAKRDDTKSRRLEKIIPMILAGRGLNDQYR